MLMSATNKYRHVRSYDVAEGLTLVHKTVLIYLKTPKYTKMLDIWMPHELIKRNFMVYVLICDSTFKEVMKSSSF